MTLFAVTAAAQDGAAPAEPPAEPPGAAQEVKIMLEGWADRLVPGSADGLLSLRVGMFTLGELVVSFLIILVTLLMRKVIVRMVFSTLRRLASRTRFRYDDLILNAIEAPVASFVSVVGIYLAVLVLPLDPDWTAVTSNLFRGILVFVFFWGLIRAVDVVIEALTDVSKKQGSGSMTGFAPLLKRSVRIFLVVVGVIMVLDNLGFNIGGVLTTLGIGGAAFAFAAKDTIANLYGSLALVLDRPFKVGDWIQVGDVVDGDVEEIGLRSTKVRTWPKTVISIPNAVLANEMINNWSRMPKRRVKQVVGVTYDTDPQTMNDLVDDIRKLLREDPGVQQDFILVNWTDFGASSLDILVYYFTTTTKWLEHMDVRQRINTKIAEAVRARGSSIAFPTRTLHLDGEVARRLAGGRNLPDDRGPQMPY